MSNLDTATATFRSNVETEYELDQEVVDQLCVFFKTNAASLSGSASSGAAAPAAGGKAKVTKKPAAKKTAEKAAPAADDTKSVRKKSAYNVFVRTMMQDDSVKALEHKDKMSAIATLWKALNEEGKAKYTKLAAELNDTESVAA
jgi:hypothetical protein